MAYRFSQSSMALAVVSNHLEELNVSTSTTGNSSINHEDGERSVRDSETASSSYVGGAAMTTTSMAYLPQTLVLCELRHDAFEGSLPSGPSDSGLVSKWRPRDRVNFLSFSIPYIIFSLVFHLVAFCGMYSLWFQLAFCLYFANYHFECRGMQRRFFLSSY